MLTRWSFSWLALLALLVACAPPVASPPTVSPQAPATTEGIHLLTDASGEVLVSRRGWPPTLFVPIGFGAELHQGDLIQVAVGGSAQLVCADLSLVEVAPGVGGVPCPTRAPVMQYGGRLISRVRGPGADIPQVRTPRQSALLDPHPLIRWRPVDGVEAYLVRVEGTAWEQEVRGITEFVYPADAPQLMPGTTYKVIVSTGDYTSDQEQIPGLGFTILDERAAQTVRQAEQHIASLGLSAPAVALVVAHLYRSSGLLAEAILHIEQLAQAAPTPTLQRTLGAWYAEVKLNDLAADAYAQALEGLPSTDLEGQAEAHYALGQLALAQGSAEARSHLLAARTFYEQSGDVARLAEIDQALAEPGG